MDQTRACSKSSRAALAWTKKKCSIRNEKLKANRASDTEEQRKENVDCIILIKSIIINKVDYNNSYICMYVYNYSVDIYCV